MSDVPVIVAGTEDLTARARLRAAAAQLFAERGVAGTSVRDIAEAVGCTAGLITHYFGGKEGLKAAVDELMVEVFTEPLTVSASSGATPATLAQALARTMAAHPTLRDYLRRSLLENDPAGSQVVDRFIVLARQLLGEMRAAGALREDLDLDWAPFHVFFLHFGPLLFGPAIERMLGVDSYAEEVVRRRSNATLELLRRGFLSTPASAPQQER
jgi:TetR/AcrR family transcriptional regulator, regulator of cefoperazone and chloramphenicol sensitivity